MCRSAHFICNTMSMLIGRLWPTPFSTAKVCVSVPAHHRDSSDQTSISVTMIMATVHLPPPEVRVIYWGLDFAGEKKGKSARVCSSGNHIQAEGNVRWKKERGLTECIECADNAAFCAEVIVV